MAGIHKEGLFCFFSTQPKLVAFGEFLTKRIHFNNYFINHDLNFVDIRP